MKNVLLLTAALGMLPLQVMAQTQAPVPVPVVAPAPAPDNSADDEEEDENGQDAVGMKKSARKAPVANTAGAVATPVAAPSLLVAPVMSTTMMIGIGAAVAVAIGVASSGGSSTSHSAVSH